MGGIVGACLQSGWRLKDSDFLVFFTSFKLGVIRVPGF